MVAAAHPLAAVAGLRILVQGGNAVDAAVATAAALNVVEPNMSGIAGVGYMLVHCAATGELCVLDYVGLAPAATRLESYADPATAIRGPLSLLVPGACGGWLEALRRFGTMDAGTVFAPAIEYAERGFALTARNCEFFAMAAADLRRFPPAAAVYLPGDRLPRPGQVLVQAELARTLRAVAAEGASWFYRGEFADRLVGYLQCHGGTLARDDLAGFRPCWLPPLCGQYRGYRLFVPPPPCQALQMLETLAIMEGFDVAAMGHNTTATLHRFIEAAKLAMADRIAYVGLPAPPTAALLHPGCAAARRALIGPRALPTGGERFARRRQAEEVQAGDPYAGPQAESTTHFDVVDAAGNAVAVTQSLGTSFGAAMVVPGTGVLLNGFMRWFDLDPDSPNAAGPGRKIEMCLAPVQVWDASGPLLLLGTPGSYGILQTTPQIIMNWIDHGMPVQAAIEAPRVKTGRPGRGVDVETRIPAAVLAGLERRGHELHRLGAWHYTLGGAQGIAIDRDSGAFTGGADPRRDGYAIGW